MTNLKEKTGLFAAWTAMFGVVGVYIIVALAPTIALCIGIYWAVTNLF